MALDLLHEKGVGLAYVARRLVPGGVDPATVTRWASRGLLVGGKRIKLDVVYCGRKLVTTPTAVAEFFAALTAAKLRERETDLDDAPDRDADTEAELQAAGLLD